MIASLDDFVSARKRRKIDRLRAMFPGTWTYNASENRWQNSEGWEVIPYSVICYGEEDKFRTEYRRSDTQEIVYL